MTKFVAYYRVSTTKQGTSGLGLEAQRHIVGQFIGSGTLINEYTEVESGKSHTNRPQLSEALAVCRKRKATLIISKLDRLGRNVAFISALMEAGVDFICCDNPHANKLMLHMMAAFAEHERELISKRTIEALAAAKARGKVLGNPRIEQAREQALKKLNDARPAAQVMALMSDWRGKGYTLATIATKLNELNIKPSRGRAWYASSVKNQLDYIARQ